VVRRTLAYTAAAGQSDISLQGGGVVDGVTCYFDNGCHPTTMITVINRTDDNPCIIKNVTIVAEDPNDVVQRIVGISQEDNVYCKNVVVESVQGNCYVKNFAQLTGEGFDPDPGTKYSYLYDDVIFRDIRFRGFDPSPTTDATSGQLTSGFLSMTRSATAYIEARYSMYDIFIGTDDTYPSAYLSTEAGSLTYLVATIKEFHNVKGQDKLSYTGTGVGTFNTATGNEYVPRIDYNDAPNIYLAKSEAVAEDDTYSQAFQLSNDGSCKVMVLYGSRDASGTRLYTEGVVVDGGGVTDYFETVAGDKTSTNTGTISISVTGSNNQFTVAKTAGSTTASGKLQVMIWHNGTVTEV